jgi:hypothetical protein
MGHKPARLPGGAATAELWGVYLAREAQQQAGEARQREAKQVVGDGRDAVHDPNIATAAGAGNWRPRCRVRGT